MLGVVWGCVYTIWTLSLAPYVGGLPYITIGSIDIKPERKPPLANLSDVYISVLTAPVYHNSRFAVQYLTWLQTVDPKNVSQFTSLFRS